MEKIEAMLSSGQKFKKVETKTLADNAKRYIKDGPEAEKEKFWKDCDKLIFVSNRKEDNYEHKFSGNDRNERSGRRH